MDAGESTLMLGAGGPGWYRAAMRATTTRRPVTQAQRRAGVSHGGLVTWT